MNELTSILSTSNFPLWFAIWFFIWFLLDLRKDYKSIIRIKMQFWLIRLNKEEANQRLRELRLLKYKNNDK